ncbi:MAG: extracellular solute-binding protein [Clostridia bacterium]|nr:extracellular solute-binding protein [Clostridia bacterium]
MKYIARLLIVCILIQTFAISFTVGAEESANQVIYNNASGYTLSEGAELEVGFSSADITAYIELEYSTVAGGTTTPQIGVSVDDGAQTVLDAPRVWQNVVEGERFKTDDMGNEQVPSQKEASRKQYMRLLLPDSNGNTENGIELNGGSHTVKFEAVRESIVVYKVVCTKVGKEPAYDEYVKAMGGKTATDKYSATYEAELSSAKSHPEIIVTYDRLTPNVTPNDPVKIIQNIIGGTGYSMPGQWVEWTVSVPKDGWYMLDFKYRQNASPGQIVRRQLYIDGEIRFSDCLEMKFPATNSFEVLSLSTADGKEAPIFLSAGDHTVRLKVVLGSVGNSLQTLKQTVIKLNQLYTKIVLIVGENPDSYRDYDLEDHIDGLLEDFDSCAKEIEAVAKNFEAEADENATNNTAQMSQIVRLLKGFVKQPRDIAVELDNFRAQINTLASLIASISTQPLELDSITVRSADTEKSVEKSGFFSVLAFRVKSFLASFASDYNSISGSGKSAMNVWVTTNAIDAMGFSTGRDQAQIITQLVKEDFYNKTKIPVNISLMDSSVILQALVSGKGPDVALFVPETILANLYYRNALIDLHEMDNYDEIEKRFYPSSLISLSYNGKTFALPEVQSYNMLYYRTDILAEYGLEVPKTWDDFYNMLTKLQKAGLQVGVAESQSIFETLLFQRNGKVYKDDLSATLLSSKESVEAFAEWTNLYTKQGVPVAFDALNRFRSGEIPIVISSTSFYNSLSVGAVEIDGLWDIAPIPGVKSEDGSINRSESCNVSGATVLHSVKNKQNAFKFLDWWTSDETQTRFAFECEIRFGVSARYFPANINTLGEMSWSLSERDALETQRKAVNDVPQSPATYFLNRNLSNAFRRVVYDYENPRDVIYRYGKDTDNELQRKLKELKLGGK